MKPDAGNPRILLPARIARDAVISVRALLTHPMDTGLAHKDGHLVPEYFVNEVTVAYGGHEVARFAWTSGISRDPYIEFPLRATREAPLTITWKDNRGGVFRQSADVEFSA